jgi:hypothetical protein
MRASEAAGRFQRRPRARLLMLSLIVMTGAVWYLAGARDPARLGFGLVGFAMLLVAVVRLSEGSGSSRRRRLGLLIIAASIAGGVALVPTHHDDPMIAIMAVGLLLALASRVAPERLPGRRLLGRCYAAIGGTPADRPAGSGP